MATEALKSTIITNADAHVANDKRIDGGIIKVCVATFEVGAFDALSTYRVCRLPANCRLTFLGYSCDAMTGGPLDIGVYQTTYNGGAVVDLDVLATDVVVTSAINTTELNHLWDVLDVAKIQMPLWQLIGVATEPIRGWEYDIVVTTSTAVTVGGTLSVKVLYVDGN